MSEFDPNRTPGTIIGAVAAATVVVPFLIVYSFLFIARGYFIGVEQPDVTSSRTGEGIAGIIAFAFLCVVLIGMGRLLNGRDRWVFVLGQAIALGTAIEFLVDSSSGDRPVPLAVGVAALTAIVMAVVPRSWDWVRSKGGTVPIRLAALTDEIDAQLGGGLDELVDGRLDSDQG